jgi:hypothetical protein
VRKSLWNQRPLSHWQPVHPTLITLVNSAADSSTNVTSFSEFQDMVVYMDAVGLQIPNT